MNSITSQIRSAVKEIYGIEPAVILTRPDEAYGDFSTNVALQIAKRTGKPSTEVAWEIIRTVLPRLESEVKFMEAAGPGFINIKLKDQALFEQAASARDYKPSVYKGKTVVAEYSDLNPFKAVHAGHLYTTIIGDSIARLIERAGGKVHRVNFGGDVGLHVGKAMWAIIGGDAKKAWVKVQEMSKKTLHERSLWMVKLYVEGTEAYETDETAKSQIIETNKQVYQLHAKDERETDFAKIYWTCREWSYQYFDSFYQELGLHPFEKYYPESQTTPLGVETVEKQLAKGVYKKSNGAVVFEGEPFGLHTRVFINSEGLPTYEAKDVGLIMSKWLDYHFDISLIITGNDIVQYMEVVLKSIEQFQPELAKRTVHLTHGNVKLEGGVKMSSRKGNTVFANDVLQAAALSAKEIAAGGDSAQTSLAAIKYSFLKQRLGGDIIFNPKESVSMEGNSGPYLQYAHARACSILAKAGQESVKITDLEAPERSLARKISQYPDVLQEALADSMPHHICTYLYQLAQSFNRFYEQCRVVGGPRQNIRLALVKQYKDVLKDGLELLGILAPERL